MLSNNFEDQTKTSGNSNTSFGNIAGHVTYTYIIDSNNEITNYVRGGIRLDNKTLEKI
ncbi:MAG: hypothetical protein P0116_16425 [Candidatus Nitrosocosmicus sp.]|nr:hypothetical protein [Candidatus Nitrosocosmicus sp.]